MKLGTGFRNPGSMGATGGAIGAGIAALLAGRKIREISENMKKLDESNLDQLREMGSNQKGGFVATASELKDLSLEPPSWFLGVMLSGEQHAGILRFVHPKKGQFKLELFLPEDAKTAYVELPKAMGDRIRINAEWSDKAQSLIKVSPRG